MESQPTPFLQKTCLHFCDSVKCFLLREFSKEAGQQNIHCCFWEFATFCFNCVSSTGTFHLTRPPTHSRRASALKNIGFTLMLIFKNLFHRQQHLLLVPISPGRGGDRGGVPGRLLLPGKLLQAAALRSRWGTMLQFLWFCALQYFQRSDIWRQQSGGCCVWTKTLAGLSRYFPVFNLHASFCSVLLKDCFLLTYFRLLLRNFRSQKLFRSMRCWVLLFWGCKGPPSGRRNHWFTMPVCCLHFCVEFVMRLDPTFIFIFLQHGKILRGWFRICHWLPARDI